MNSQLNLATIWEHVADAVPDALAVVQGDRRTTWHAYEDRASRLASALADGGIGRDSKVALYLYNSPEYAEAQFATFKQRAVPINVNYRYLDDELVYLLENSDAEAVVFHARFADRIDRVIDRVPDVRTWIQVADESGSHVERAHDYESLIRSFSPAPRIQRGAEDHYILYTGGTTGMPKGVVYEVGTLASRFMAQRTSVLGLDALVDPARAPAVAKRLVDEERADIALPACPLMHGTGNWSSLMGPHVIGGTCVLLSGRSFDPREFWSTVSGERVVSAAIVGESFARPLLRELQLAEEAGRPYELTRFRILLSSGAMFAADTKAALLEHLPHVTIMDSISASEGTMGMTVTVKRGTSETARFSLAPTTRVLNEDGRPVEPGEVGFVAVSGTVPIGYYKDPVKSAATFREIDGVRYSIPGDLAVLLADGSIRLLGRGNNCINTGGEKVFPEEVEEAIKSHPMIEDCLVVGVPDERFGQRVGAVASRLAGATLTPDEVIEFARARLAGYKVPRSVTFVDTVPRTASGKADYTAARALI